VWVVREKGDEGWTTRILPGHTQRVPVTGTREVAVSAVNRIGVEGPAATIQSPAAN
jgi:hypothetical protein